VNEHFEIVYSEDGSRKTFEFHRAANDTSKDQAKDRKDFGKHFDLLKYNGNLLKY
jgi:hypothetical protein